MDRFKKRSAKGIHDQKKGKYNHSMDVHMGTSTEKYKKGNVKKTISLDMSIIKCKIRSEPYF